MKKVKKVVSMLAIALLLSACAAQPSQKPKSEPAASVSTTSTAQAESAVGKKIAPLPATLKMDTLTDAIVAASFTAKDLTTASAGVHSLSLTVYDYELFDLVDISTMAVGDTIVVGQEEVKIDTLEKNALGLIIVNGGIENGGMCLNTDSDTVYYQSGMDGMKYFFEVGQAPFNISDSFQFVDNSDLDKPNQVFDYAAFEKKLQSGEIDCNQFNTTVAVADGDIVEISLSFVP